MPTSEPKTPGPSPQGVREIRPPQVRAQKPGGGCREAPGQEDPSKKKFSPIFTKRGGHVGRGVGRCAAKTAGGYLPPPASTAARSKCAKSRQLPLGTDTPGVATGTLGWMWTKLTGDLPHTEAHLPRRRPVDAWLLRRAALAGAECAKSRLGAAGRGRGLVDGETGCSPACLNPLGTLTFLPMMMDRSLTIISHRVSRWIRRPREPWGQAAARPLVPLPLEKSNSRQGFALLGR